VQTMQSGDGTLYITQSSSSGDGVNRVRLGRRSSEGAACKSMPIAPSLTRRRQSRRFQCAASVAVSSSREWIQCRHRSFTSIGLAIRLFLLSHGDPRNAVKSNSSSGRTPRSSPTIGRRSRVRGSTTASDLSTGVCTGVNPIEFANDALHAGPQLRWPIMSARRT
jgi:hypothetical protein